MLIARVRDLGLYIRGRREELRLTRAQAAAAAGVSNRWLANVEAGKETAEIGLIFKTLDALHLTVSLQPTEELPAGPVDLDQLIRSLGPRP